MASDQTPIEKAREWYLDYYDLHDLAANGLAKDDEQTIEMLAAFDVHVEAQRSPASYAMSRDYDKLYDRLCAGGEALGAYGSMNPKQGAFIYRGNQCAYIGHTVVHDDSQAFVEVCQQMNLEWLAPAQPTLSVDKIMEVYHEHERWFNLHGGAPAKRSGNFKARINKLLKTNDRE